MITIKFFVALLALSLFVSFVSASEAGEKISLTIEDKIFSVEAEDNVTAKEIFKHMPLTLDMKRYGGHEFFADLPFRPEQSGKNTTLLKAGHIYYWPGGNSFVINYEEFDSAPYREIHIGTVNEAEEICAYLSKTKTENNLSVKFDLR